MGRRELQAHLGELDTNCNSSSFLKSIMKMADVDINPFIDHYKTDAQPDKTGETIPLNPEGVVVVGGAIWEPRMRNIIGRSEY